MAFEQKDTFGSIFKNTKKTKDSQPDYKGSIKVDGKQWDLGGWVKEDKNGNKFISLKASPPFVKEEHEAVDKNATPDDPDQLPF